MLTCQNNIRARLELKASHFFYHVNGLILADGAMETIERASYLSLASANSSQPAKPPPRRPSKANLMWLDGSGGDQQETINRTDPNQDF